MREIANLELGVLARELDVALAGARLQKFYELGENEFRLEFHAPRRGTLDLAVELKKRLHLTKYVKPAPGQPSQFAMQLRKHLDGAEVRHVLQAGTDRVLVIGLGVKTDAGILEKKLVLEMFSNGNIALTGDNDKIIACYRMEEWSDRKIKRGEAYALPASPRLNPFTLTREQLAGALKSRKKLVAALAASVDLGGTYLEEVVARAGMDVKTPAEGLHADDVEKLLAAFAEVSSLAATPKPTAYFTGGVPVEFAAFPLKKPAVAGLEAKEYPSFSELLDDVTASACEPSAERKAASVKFAEEKVRIESVLRSQADAVARLQGEAEAEKAAGDKLYERFEEIEELLQAIRAARKSNKSWKEIEGALAGAQRGVRVKRIVPENGEIFVEL